MIFSKEQNKRNLLLWISILVITGYPISASLSVFAGLNSTPFNIFYRGVIVFLCVIYLSHKSYWNNVRIKLPNKILILFWFFYLIRLYNDLLIGDIKLGNYGSFSILSFAIGNCFLPFLVLSMGTEFLNLNQFKKYLFSTCFLANAMILIAVIIQNNGFSAQLFLGRISVTSLEDESNLTINTIMISFYGGLLFIISFFLLLKKSQVLNKAIVLSGLFLGFLGLILGASRGPILSVMLITAILIISFFPKFKVPKLSSLFIIIIIIVSSVVGLKKFDLQNDFIGILRVTNFFEEKQYNSQNSDEGRIYEWKSSWNQFLNNPVIGDKIINDYDNYYPHNVFLEVLQSTGLIGGIPFFMAILLILNKMRKNRQSIITYLILINLLFGFTSGSLYFNVGMWSTLAMWGLMLPKNNFKLTPKTLPNKYDREMECS